MKNFVSGWRRTGSKAGRPADTAERPARPEFREAEPAPVEKRRKPAPVPDAEVIDAPRRPARPLNFPTLRAPGNLGQWMMLAVFAGLFKLSADATHAAVGGALPDYWWAVGLQASISCVERFHFAGNRNGFTWGTLVVDTALTATGLGLVLLPALFTTPVYDFVTGTLLGGFGAGGVQGFSLGVLALAVGFIVAYSGDKALDLAMGR